LVKKELNTSMTGARAFFVVFCLVLVAFGALPGSPTAVNDTANNTTTIAPSIPTEVATPAPIPKSEVTPTQKQNIENTPITFEEQLRKEISNRLTNENKISYDIINQALTVDIFAHHYLTSGFLKSGMFLDTTDILKIAAKYPDKIKYVDINYKATLLDQNRNEFIGTVYVGRYFTTNTNPVNWDNTYGDDREYMLRKRANYFWIDPIFNQPDN
jgi:hypothetical protein